MRLKGTFTVPGDKSVSHRVALMAILAEGLCRIENLASGADVQSSLEAASALGCRVRLWGTATEILGAGGRAPSEARIDCGNSGTTMRLLMGVLAGRDGKFVLDGDDSLRRRPMDRVANPLRLMDARIDCPNGMSPVQVIGGTLRGIEYELPVPSAQVKSAMLLAGVQANGWTVAHEPIPSRDHTERMLEAWGARIERGEKQWKVERSSLALPQSLSVPGDISSAAFFVCAAAIMPDSDVIAEGVVLNPTRGGFLDVLHRMGADVTVERRGESPEPWGDVRVRFSPHLTGVKVEPEEVPLLVDEVPILALVASQAEGETVFAGVDELRVKESDRIEAIVSQMRRLGVDADADANALRIRGPAKLRMPARLDSFGDHRIAMTLRLAAALVGADPIIEREECASISFPGFHQTLRELAR